MGLTEFIQSQRESSHYSSSGQEAASAQVLAGEVSVSREELVALRRRSSYYQVLYQAVISIDSSLHLPEVLKATCESTATAMGAKGCSILLLSRDGQALVHSATYGLSDSYMRKGAVSVDMSIADTLLGQTVAIEDAACDPRVQYGPQNQEEGISSILSVPMRPHGDVIGVMRVYTSRPRQFTVEDTEFVKAIANLGALAIERATIYDALRDQYEILRQQKIPWAENFHKPAWRG